MRNAIPHGLPPGPLNAVTVDGARHPVVFVTSDHALVTARRDAFRPMVVVDGELVDVDELGAVTFQPS